MDENVSIFPNTLFCKVTDINSILKANPNRQVSDNVPKTLFNNRFEFNFFINLKIYAVNHIWL